jgi:hypothetical protein
MISTALITVDRSPSHNYLGETLSNLERGISRLEREIHICDSSHDPSWIRDAHSCSRLSLHVSSAEGGRCASHNYSAALRAASESGDSWVLVLEDDIDVIADFWGSIERWIDEYERPDRRVYPLGAAYPQVLESLTLRRESFWDYPIDKFYGTQAVLFRRDDALKLATYLTHHAFDREQDGTAWDLLIADWSRCAYPGISHFRTPAPSFVEHIGRGSVVRPRSFTHRFESWPGSDWSYQAGRPREIQR